MVGYRGLFIPHVKANPARGILHKSQPNPTNSQVRSGIYRQQATFPPVFQVFVGLGLVRQGGFTARAHFHTGNRPQETKPLCLML